MQATLQGAQEGPAEGLIGFHDRSLTPLVPRFYKHYARVRHRPLLANGLPDRVFEYVRVKAMQKDPSPARARRVVEPRHDARVLPDSRSPPGKHPVRERLVVREGPGALAQR